jgi:hypothetical protein
VYYTRSCLKNHILPMLKTWCVRPAIVVRCWRINVQPRDDEGHQRGALARKLVAVGRCHRGSSSSPTSSWFALRVWTYIVASNTLLDSLLCSTSLTPYCCFDPDTPLRLKFTTQLPHTNRHHGLQIDTRHFVRDYAAQGGFTRRTIP